MDCYQIFGKLNLFKILKSIIILLLKNSIIDDVIRQLREKAFCNMFRFTMKLTTLTTSSRVDHLHVGSEPRSILLLSSLFPAQLSSLILSMAVREMTKKSHHYSRQKLIYARLLDVFY